MGLAEQVDVGNQDQSDYAFVFSGDIIEGSQDSIVLASALTNIIAHESGHLLGYVHDIETTDAGVFADVAGSPDLITYGISASDTTVNPGQSVTIYWTAKNQGSSATGWYPGGTSQQGIMWSTNSAISTSDTLLEKEFLGWMGSGNTSPESHTITIPSNASPGSSYWIGVIADYDNNISESNESNNDDGIPVQVTVNIPPKPDLIVQDISISPSSPTAGESATITATLKNQGNANASGSIRLNYYVDGSYIGDDYLSLGLNAGSSNSESISYTVSSSGNHSVQVIIDSNNIVSESNETNNSRTETYTWQSPPKPDLIVQDISISPSSPIAEQSATITATLKNQGNANASGSIRLNYYVDGSYIGDDYLSLGLNAGSSDTESISYTVSSSGNHSVQVIIDSNNIVSESNESNNSRTETYTWQSPPKPDLIVEDIWTEPSTVVEGQNYKIMARIKNQGNAVADAGLLANQEALFYVDGTKYGEGDDYDGLAPGAILTVESINLTGPSAGSHTLKVKADGNNEVSESNESNNERSESISVQVAPKPDLIVEDIWTEPSTVVEGQNYKIKARIKNQGNATADAGLLANQEALFYVDGTKYGEGDDYDGLAPGATLVVESINLTGPSEGNHALKVKADGNNEVVESNESNNDLIKTITVAESFKPDLAVISVTETLSGYQIGDKINARVTVQNIGKEDADDCKVYYYLGTATNKEYKPIGYGLLAEGEIWPYDGMQPDEIEEDIIWDVFSGGWTIPNDVSPGTYYVYCHAVTSSNDPNSSNDWNKSSPFTITGKVDSVSWSKSEVEAGEYVNVTISGVGLSGTIPLALYEDDDDGSPTNLGITISVPVSDTTGSAQWRADWIPDTGNFLGDIHPEYTLYYAEDDEWSGELHVKDTKSMESSNGLTVAKSGDNWAFNWDDTQDYGGDYGSGLDHYVLVVSNDPDFDVNFWDRLWTDDTLKKYDTGTASQYTVTDLEKDYYYWKVLAYDQAENDPSMSANGPEFGSTVTNLWFENEHGDILDEDDILIVGQTVKLRVATKGLVGQTLAAQIFEDDWALLKMTLLSL